MFGQTEDRDHGVHKKSWRREPPSVVDMEMKDRFHQESRNRERISTSYGRGFGDNNGPYAFADAVRRARDIANSSLGSEIGKRLLRNTRDSSSDVHMNELHHEKTKAGHARIFLQERTDNIYERKSWRDQTHVKTRSEFRSIDRDWRSRSSREETGSQNNTNTANDGLSWRDPGHRKSRKEFPLMRGDRKESVSNQDTDGGLRIGREPRETITFLDMETSSHVQTETGQDREIDNSVLYVSCGEKEVTGSDDLHLVPLQKMADDTKEDNLPSPKPTESITLHTLKSWSDSKDNKDVLSQMFSHIEGVENLLMSDNMTEEWYALLVQIFAAILHCQTNSFQLEKVLHVICTSHFLTHLLSNFLDFKEEQGRSWTSAEMFFKSIIEIVQHIAKRLPEKVKNCKPALKCLQGMIHCIEPVSGNEELQNLIASALLSVTEAQNAIAEKHPEKNWYGPNFDSDTPPEDFRELSVIPTASDFSMGAKPFVRAVITKGAYRDEEHYLDIQFRLMREDFIKPLRRGIQEYREHSRQNKVFLDSGIRIYHDVHFIEMISFNGIHYVIQFDVSNMKHVKWDHSKVLLNGNLLCLSNDNFQSNLVFATVSFRDPELLKSGIISVDCVSGLDVILKTSSRDAFVMAETVAFFEAVHPILKGLQTIDSDLPLKEYIISCQKQLKPPKYLLQNVRKYDISCLMKTPQSVEVSVLNHLSWPSSENMCLNPSQRDAAILALTKEISIIQGPPGTGKTYVGLKVMQVLLKNQDRMLANERSDRDPILVICYTNHALDQFLNGIIAFCPKGVVRVGGRSSPDLEPFNLHNLIKERRESGLFNEDISNLYSYLENCTSQIHRLRNRLATITTDVLSEDVLSVYMCFDHRNSLMTGSREAKSKIHQWLNASDESLSQKLPEIIRHHMTKLVIKFLQLNRQKDEHLWLKERQPIVERVQIYGCWLLQYQVTLKKKLEVNGTQRQNDEKDLSALYHQSCRLSILSDSELSDVIPAECFDIIKNVFGIQSNLLEKSNRLIEAWVLGLQNNCDKQLDEFEQLRKFNTELEFPKENHGDDFDDLEESQNVVAERQLFEDEKRKSKFLDAIKNVMKESTFLLKRAKSLGISERPEAIEQFDERDNDGWTAVTSRKPSRFSNLERYLSDEYCPPISEEEAEAIVDIWVLNMKDRFALYKLWVKKYQETLVSKVESLIAVYNDTKQKLMEFRMKEDVRVLRQAKVIGMTTTGAAKKRAWLKAVGCRIIIVEEAAEVLEAHIVTALNENCKHLILIGDHKQLRPNPTVYEHAKNFGLDVSLFERLVNNDIPHVTLREQHRMRESISIIMKHIYPDLQDHISVKDHEDIRGVSKNIFFIQHDHNETSAKDSLSKSNPFEAMYLIRLCKYLLLQGYEASQITILATYGGQVLRLKKEMKDRRFKENVRVSTVDNFQGEENDIILLSLVRSNEQSIAGFLKVDNRVCVALSRAKKGMFAIGNLALLASQSKLWEKIKQTAEIEGITGDGFPVSCPNHPDEKNVMRVPRDFDRCPKGGCLKKCDFRLECGHICQLICHGYDLQHEEVTCNAPCNKSCPVGHPCRRRCWQECGECIVKIQKTISECGHTNLFLCSKIPEETECYSRCEEVLPCGHRCTGKCGECKMWYIHKTCQVPVTYTWPCDHAVEVPCHFKPCDNPCPKACNEMLQCGHQCPGKCSDCLHGAVHVACAEKCKNVLFCGHICQSPCGAPCPPCSLMCLVACPHGRCNHLNENKIQRCGEACVPCQEPCENECPHRECTRSCHEICDVVPCEEPCPKTVKECGHPCAGLCGEICVCRFCQRVLRCKKLEKGELNSLHAKNCQSKLLYRVPSCRHIFNLEDFDEYMTVEDKNSNTTHFLLCPHCSTPIQNCHRYDHVLKERFIKREEKKKTEIAQNRMTIAKEVMIDKSLRLVQENDPDWVWIDWVHIDRQDVSSFGELLALTMKLKFAYVINVIMSLKEKEEIPLTGEAETERVSSLLKVGRHICAQQMEEYNVDLTRLLMLRYCVVLKMMAQSHGVELSEEIAKSCIDVEAALRVPNPAADVLERELGAVDILTLLEKSIGNECCNPDVQASLGEKKRVFREALNVLNAEHEKMLCEVINNCSPCQEKPNHEKPCWPENFFLGCTDGSDSESDDAIYSSL